ncbi:MAG: cytochrome c biogenesis protein CcsA, partial [Bacillota bacterium]
MIGSTGIYIAFLAGSVATLLYLYSAVKDDPGVLRVSHFAFFVHTTGIVVASVYLLYALLGHKFQYYYVYAYTERALELRYIISAFWAGQEGTLLLWALIAALIGMVLLFRERELLAPVMTFLCAGQLFLLFFLVVENPFRLLPQMPADGAGLNPLLLDPWMTLHPPVVFAGYALFFVPYAYAAAGLWKNDYMGWAKKALPWSLAGWFFLSVGIFIGGYWAYRVLGWGGYWSWDPVENASLIPWLTGAALIHGLLLQKKLNRMLISNALFAIVTYVLIIYATFLTRSGVLTDFSVHSFAETPLKNYLAAFLFLFLLVGFGLFTIRFINFKKHGQGNPLTFSISLYWLFAGGIILLLGMAGFIALGTSSPLITSLLGAPASVDESFYVRTSTPLAVLLLLLLGLAPYLSWQERPASSVLYDAMPAGLGGLAGVVTALFAGIREPYALVFVFAAVFALFAALGGLYSALRRKRLRLSGAYLAHAGVAMLLIGMLFSMGYTSNEVVSLSEGGSSQALGYQVSYVQRIDEQNEG